MGEVPDCEKCWKKAERQKQHGRVWKVVKHDFPPIKCERCAPVWQLDALSIQAWNIFVETQNQVVFSYGGEWVGINQMAIWELVERSDVPKVDERELFKRVRDIEDIYAKRHNDRVQKQYKEHEAEMRRIKARTRSR